MRPAAAGSTSGKPFDIPPDAIERFWQFVRRGDGCWMWMGGGTPTRWRRYGTFCFPKNQRVGAPRAAYRIAKGPIPEGAVVMHTCDNPRCVNPGHLVLGSQFDNVADARRKGRLGGRRSVA